MARLKEEIRKLRDPTNINNAGLASSPYVLRKVFAADPRIRRIIGFGEKTLPLVAQELREKGKLSEISLAAFAFIIENIDPNAAADILGPEFRKKLEKPGPFFVHFAAHVLRTGYRMPLKPMEMVYTAPELAETSARLR
jgi:hypothetical protein